MSRLVEPNVGRPDAGFTMIEALVALAVIAVSLVAIGSLVAANVRGTRVVESRLALIETTRAILAALPDRAELTLGNSTGEFADNRWRIDVLPFTADFYDPTQQTPWVPQAVVVRVQSPTGEILRVDTVRLGRAQGSVR